MWFMSNDLNPCSVFVYFLCLDAINNEKEEVITKSNINSQTINYKCINRGIVKAGNSRAMYNISNLWELCNRRLCIYIFNSDYLVSNFTSLLQ